MERENLSRRTCTPAMVTFKSKHSIFLTVARAEADCNQGSATPPRSRMPFWVEASPACRASIILVTRFSLFLATLY